MVGAAGNAAGAAAISCTIHGTKRGATLHFADLRGAMMPRKEVCMTSVSTDAPKLDTTGRIAAKLGVPVHRVQYIISTRAIAPAAYAGRLRLYDRDAVAMVRHALTAIDARRGEGGAA